MQTRNGRILLSPSDLNEYVECQHASALSLEVVRGKLVVARDLGCI